MPHDLTIGGCNGMTPFHHSHMALHIAPLKPRSIPERPDAPRLTGLKPFDWAS